MNIIRKNKIFTPLIPSEIIKRWFYGKLEEVANHKRDSFGYLLSGSNNNLCRLACQLRTDMV